MTVSVTGIGPTTEALRKKLKRFPSIVTAALYVEAWEVMREALKLVPVDTGALRRSHYVTRPTLDESGHSTLRMGFVAPYAGVVHEDMNAEHINGTAKYLERPMLQAASSWGQRIASRAAALAANDVGIEVAPTLGPVAGEFRPTGAKSRHRGRGAAARDRKARSKVAERMAQRAARDAARGV